MEQRLLLASVAIKDATKSRRECGYTTIYDTRMLIATGNS